MKSLRYFLGEDKTADPYVFVRGLKPVRDVEIGLFDWHRLGAWLMPKELAPAYYIPAFNFIAVGFFEGLNVLLEILFSNESRSRAKKELQELMREVEADIEEAIKHETIHWVLMKLTGYEGCLKFDNVADAVER